MRSRADELKRYYDPLDEGDGGGFTAQSASRPPSAGDRLRSPSSRPRPSAGDSGALPPSRATLPRKGTASGRSQRRRVDDDFDTPQTPSLRNRRDSQRRRNRNDYDDEVMGGIFGDEDDDGLL